MTLKIILVLTMLIGAILVYLANPIANLIKLSEDKEKNMLTVKIIGFITVAVSAIIVFVKF